MAVIWDEAHLKALLRLPRYPFSMLTQPPWQEWIEARGGLVAVYEYLRTCLLSDEQRSLLDTILKYPGAPAEWYADRLYISRRTYFRRLEELIQTLLQRLNAWPSHPERFYTSLPVPVTSLIGADRVVEAISALLLRPDVRMVTLTGPGGIGKTRLAIEVAWQLRGRFKAGVCFVPLAPVESEDMLVIQIARSLGVETVNSQPLLDLLKTSIRELELLLVLDNFEQIIPAGPLVSELLEATQHLKVLITSREMLNLYGEHRFEVPLLPLPDREHLLPLEQLLECPAVRLFVERARAVCQEFALTESNAAAVAEICHRLDGLPLAIELAAAQVYQFMPGQICAQLEHPLVFLQSGPRDKPARHQALRNTIAWSYNLLEERERTLFRRLAVFHCWDVVAAETVCQVTETRTLLDALARKSLAQVVEPNGAYGPRFQMLQTVREYAREQLDTSGETEAVRRRHAAYYLALAEQAEPYVGAGRQSYWVVRIEKEHDNLRAALAWMLERGEPEMALRMVGSLWRFWQVLGYLTEGRRWIEQALEHGRHVRTRARIRALLGAGWLAVSQGYVTDIHPAFIEGLTLARALGERRLLSSLLQGIGYGIADRDPEQGRKLFEEGLDIAREHGDDEETAWALDNLGQLERERGNYELAQRLLEQSLTLFRKLEHRWGTSYVLDHLGRVVLDQGDTEKACSMLEEALTYMENFGARWHIPWTLEALAHALIHQGHLARARSLLERSLRLHLEAENRVGVALVLSGFAALAAATGDYVSSAQLGGAAGTMIGVIDPDRPPVIRSHIQRVLEKDLAAARIHLDARTFAAAWLRGQAMTREEAIAFALHTAGLQ